MIRKFNLFLFVLITFQLHTTLAANSCWTQVQSQIVEKDKQRDSLYRQITRNASGIFDRQGSLFLEGQVNSRAIVLLHGYPSFPRHFGGLAKLLNEKYGYTIYAPLLSGLGSEAKVGNKVTLEDWRKDVEDALTLVRQCTHNVSIVAHSMGGGLAIDSVFNPIQNSVNSIALICPMVKTQTTLGRILAAIMRTIGIRTVGQISTRLVKQVFRVVDNIQNYWDESPRNQIPTFLSVTMDDLVLKPDASYNFPMEKMNVVDTLIYPEGSKIGHNEIITPKNPYLENLAQRLDQFFQKY